METIIFNIIHHSPPLWSYLPTIYQSLFKYQNISVQWYGWKKFLHPGGVGGDILNYQDRGGGWFIMIIKVTVYTLAPLWNSPFTSVQDKYFSFRCHSGVLGLIDLPQQGEQVFRGCQPFEKYSHSVDHLPRYNITLFLKFLILDFLYATVSILLPRVYCPFQKRSTKNFWRFKRSGLVSWRLWRPKSSIQFFCVRMGVYGLGSIRCVLLSMAMDKKYITIIEWIGNRGGSLLYYLTLKLQCLDISG